MVAGLPPAPATDAGAAPEPRSAAGSAPFYLLAWRELYPWFSLQMFPLLGVLAASRRVRRSTGSCRSSSLTTLFTLSAGPAQVLFAWKLAAPVASRHHSRWFVLFLLVVDSSFYTELEERHRPDGAPQGADGREDLEGDATRRQARRRRASGRQRATVSRLSRGAASWRRLPETVPLRPARPLRPPRRPLPRAAEPRAPRRRRPQLIDSR